MRREIEEGQQQHAPRPRFRFKSRADVEARRAKGHVSSKQGGAEGPDTEAASAQTGTAGSESRAGPGSSDETVFADQTGQDLVIRPGELARAGKGGDVRLSNLEDCVVSLCDVVTSLHMVGLRRCHVYVGAVASSAMVDDCVECTVMAASGQVSLRAPRPHVCTRPHEVTATPANRPPSHFVRSGSTRALAATYTCACGATPSSSTAPASAWRPSRSPTCR